MNSLLSHLMLKRKGTGENLATESLKYFFDNSPLARRQFIAYVSGMANRVMSTDLDFVTQASGSDRERPDMVGTDAQGAEVIIVECKFWAGLTENQPVKYLQRLSKLSSNSNRVLAFIVPEARQDAVWAELLRRCEAAGCKLEKTGPYSSLTSNVTLVLTTWSSVLATIRGALNIEQNSALQADLHQLESYCKTIDDTAFLPLTANDVSPAQARRIRGYYEVIEAVATRLREHHGWRTEGLRPVPSSDGFLRYMRWGNYGMSPHFSTSFWLEHAETPFWLGVNKIVKDEAGKEHWTRPQDTKDRLGRLPFFRTRPITVSHLNTPIVPLFAPLGVEMDAVVDSLVAQILEVMAILGEERGK